MAIFDVISYEGSNDVLVYKFPHTEFNTLSQLTVHEGQEAIFFKDGQMLDVFGPGNYTLHTKNIPLLNKLINLPFGGESPFKCEVYFVNKVLALNYKWGTMSKTRVMDNQFQLYLDMGASGTLGLKVINPQMLLRKIVGTESMLTAEACLNYFRENVSVNVKQYLACVMSKQEMNFVVLDMHLKDFAAAVKEMLQDEFRDVGVELYNFLIGTISIPEEQYNVIVEGQQALQRAHYEKQLKLLEAQGDADAQVVLSQGRAKSRQIEGYNWADEQVAEITKLYATNANLQQNPANMIAQAPMALAFGNMLRGNMEPLMGMQFSNPPMNFNNQQDNKSRAESDLSDNLFVGMSFGSEMDDDILPEEDIAGAVILEENMSGNNDMHNSKNVSIRKFEIKARLKELKECFDEELIDEEEYKEAKQDLLNKMKTL